MDLHTFIITVFCIIDDITEDICSSVRLRQRGPAPTLADSEALTIEVVGEYLGLGQGHIRSFPSSPLRAVPCTEEDHSHQLRQTVSQPVWSQVAHMAEAAGERRL